jgi:hypothetical protein
VRARALALLAAVPLVLSACESTADKSARIAREGKRQVAAAGKVRVKPNADVRVARAVVVRGEGGAAAAAVELRNRSGRAQADVPVLIDVRDAQGASVYRNDGVGLQPALQRLSVLRGHGSAWWVNDQLLGAQAARTVHARVGAAGRPHAAPLRISLRDVHFETDATGRFLTGVVVNPSRLALRDVAIFGVALRGGRVAAAGRALVPKLPAAGAPKKTTFRLFFVGDPRGARVALTVAPPPEPSSS